MASVSLTKAKYKVAIAETGEAAVEKFLLHQASVEVCHYPEGYQGYQGYRGLSGLLFLFFDDYNMIIINDN